MVEVAWPGWVRGKGAPAASRGRHFSRPLGSFFWRLQDPGWGVGSVRGPAAAPARSPLGSLRSLGVAWVTYPELGTRQSRSPQARQGCLHTPAPRAQIPLAPSALTARSGARTRRRSRRAVGGPQSRPAPPSAPPHLLPEREPYSLPMGSGSISTHLADGETESQQRRLPRAL